jgi:hypothetical protein
MIKHAVLVASGLLLASSAGASFAEEATPETESVTTHAETCLWAGQAYSIGAAFCSEVGLSIECGPGGKWGHSNKQQHPEVADYCPKPDYPGK